MAAEFPCWGQNWYLSLLLACLQATLLALIIVVRLPLLVPRAVKVTISDADAKPDLHVACTSDILLLLLS